MTDLTITTSKNTATLYHGERVVGHLKRDEFTGEITLPLSALATDTNIRRELGVAANEADRIDALTGIWGWLDEKVPTAEAFYVEYESEYNDEGGYYMSLRGLTLYKMETP